MKYYIDTQDNSIWAFKDSVDPFEFPNSPTTLQLIEETRPSLDHQYENGQWVLPTLTNEQLLNNLIDGVQNFLDSKAREKQYDDIKSAALRAAYPGPFQQEGIAYASWMDQCWYHCYQVKAEVENNTRSVPTLEELIAEFPTLVLP